MPKTVTIVDGSYFITFGKHKGKTLDKVSDEDPSYITWLADNEVLKINKSFLHAVKMDIYDADHDGKEFFNG